ncbi:MAG: hypothetical protein KJ880_08530, partial [Candidatus Omnitrophica bacterium]|nr:hypothetical protein [Candidatus Omnitrophota bacterium]
MIRRGFQLKLSIIFACVMILVLFASGYLIYKTALGEQKEELRSKIVSMAKLSSLLINGDLHSSIKPEIASQATPAYIEIKSILEKIRKSDSLIDSVYTMVKSNKEDIWVFIVDSGNKRGITAYCGERYDVSRFPEMRKAFTVPSVDKKCNIDKWGMFLSGYAPIYNSQKEVVAIVGIDVTAKSIQRLQLLLAKKIGM